MVMIDQKVSCPNCGETSNIWKWGKRCQNDACYRETFILDYTYQGYQEWVKRQSRNGKHKMQREPINFFGLAMLWLVVIFHAAIYDVMRLCKDI